MKEFKPRPIGERVIVHAPADDENPQDSYYTGPIVETIGSNRRAAVHIVAPDQFAHPGGTWCQYTGLPRIAARELSGQTQLNFIATVPVPPAPKDPPC